jgi:hypothetical protein
LQALTLPNATNSSPARSAMAIFKDTIIVDGPFDRVVEVTVIYPEGMNITNVQELAEKAWRSVNKQISIGGVTVKVRAFRR